MRRLLTDAFGSLYCAGLVLGILFTARGAAAESTLPAIPSTHRHPRVSTELTDSARKYYQLLWGIDIIGVKPVSSGAMLRFSYRVVNAKKAKPLHDKKADPRLVDQKTGARLVIPTMEKIGQLRQSATPENGREYWMLFSNKGGLVKPGSRVDVLIGNFRAEGLIVRSE